MIPPDAGREPRTDSPKFRCVPAGESDLPKIPSKGKRKGGAALGEPLSRLPGFDPFSPSTTNASYLVGVPTRIPLGRGEFRAPPHNARSLPHQLLSRGISRALNFPSSRSHATPARRASIAPPPPFRARPNTLSLDFLSCSTAHTRSQTSPKLR